MAGEGLVRAFLAIELPDSVRAGLGGHHPLVIGGREIDTAKRLTSVNPAQPDEVIGTTAYGGRAVAEAAVAAARAALAAWRDTPGRITGVPKTIGRCGQRMWAKRNSGWRPSPASGRCWSV